jgi:hypothetical protein
LDRELVTQLHVNSIAAERLAWGDYIYVGLWNSCTHHVGNSTSVAVTECTSPSISFVFDPVSVWSLNGSNTGPASIVLPSVLVNTLENHSVHTMWIKIMFIMALTLSVVGWTAGAIGTCTLHKNRPFGRRLLYIATLNSMVVVVLLLIGSSLATHAYTALLGALSPSFGDVITFLLGRSAVALLWLSTIFALLATISWVVMLRKGRKMSSHGKGFGGGGRRNRQQGAYTMLEGNGTTAGGKKKTAAPPLGEKYEPYKHMDTLHAEHD